MHDRSVPVIDGDVVESDFLLDGIPGILWLPSAATASAPAPLILLGHPGGLAPMRPRLAARARQAAAEGIACATIEMPGAGARPASAEADRARAELRAALAAGEAPSEEVIDRLILPLVEQAAPEWRAVIDLLLARPEIGGPVALSGGVISLGVRLALDEPRLVAAGLFAGSYVPRSIIDDAHRVTIPLHVLLQWDDEGNDRSRALELFDAFGSTEKTLQANLGGHRGVPAFAGDDAGRFFARHLTAPRSR